MITKTNRKLERDRRHLRVRKKISGTADRPRLCVYRSNNNLFVQVIDDVQGTTIASASTLDKEVKVKCKEERKMNVKKIVTLALCSALLLSTGVQVEAKDYNKKDFGFPYI